MSFHARDATIRGALSDLKGALDELGFAGAGLVGHGWPMLGQRVCIGHVSASFEQSYLCAFLYSKNHIHICSDMFGLRTYIQFCLRDVSLRVMRQFLEVSMMTCISGDMEEHGKRPPGTNLLLLPGPAMSNLVASGCCRAFDGQTSR